MFYPEVGVTATLEQLEKLGVAVDYPSDQTCCGQPMANSGVYQEAKATEELFIRDFGRYDQIVAPSGSFVHHLCNKFTRPTTPRTQARVAHVHDLSEFLCDVLKVEDFAWAEFPDQVALHVGYSAARRRLARAAPGPGPDTRRPGAGQRRSTGRRLSMFT